MQIRILSRLQDRPPKYETQHNYDTRIQIDRERHNPETLPDSSPTPIPTVSTDAIYLAPPAYDDGRYSVSFRYTQKQIKTKNMLFILCS